MSRRPKRKRRWQLDDEYIIALAKIATIVAVIYGAGPGRS
jgi:hypothetical protein